MNESIVSIIAIVIVALSLIVVYQHLELSVKIKDLVNVTLKANKDVEEQKEEPDLQSDSPNEKN
ncbi:hypothetical protein ACQCN2_19590 [Brevibacillus ginsengisoli]|uniref:hypothetical protein n=1 Tax=Brevibacillus ginsengisoli TaxID=363854 RepID=UPI003CE925B5